jgi:hypothetical protein
MLTDTAVLVTGARTDSMEMPITEQLIALAYGCDRVAEPRPSAVRSANGAPEPRPRTAHAERSPLEFEVRRINWRATRKKSRMVSWE